MDKHNYLLSFLYKVVQDPKITKTHISVYMALFYLWSKQHFHGQLSVFSRQIMPIARISYTGTYYTVMKELDEYGYLKYYPSFYGKQGSQVNLEITE